jgi:hypothetical protein
MKNEGAKKSKRKKKPKKLEKKGNGAQKKMRKK